MNLKMSRDWFDCLFQSKVKTNFKIFLKLGSRMIYWVHRVSTNSKCIAHFALFVQKKMFGPGADPIKNFQRQVEVFAGIWPIREATIGHVTDVIGWFHRRVKVHAEILFIGSAPKDGPFPASFLVYFSSQLTSQHKKETFPHLWHGLIFLSLHCIVWMPRCFS